MTSPGEARSYRLPVWPWAALFSALGPIGILGRISLGVSVPVEKALILLIGPLFMAMIALWICQVRVSEQGIVLNRINRTSWEDVIEARLRRFFGLEYLWVRRRAGVAWWIPLYVEGKPGIRESLQDMAPPNHCIRAVFG